MNDVTGSITQACSLLSPMVERLESGLGFQHWIGGGDQGPSYCYLCASKLVEQLNTNRDPQKEKCVVDGGWGQESDSCCACEECGNPLEYTLTDCGVDSELDHFNSIEGTIKINEPRVAYELYQLFEAGRHIKGVGESLRDLANRLDIEVTK